MPVYRYVAVGPDGAEVKDTVEAPNEDVLRNELMLRNLEVRGSSTRRSSTSSSSHRSACPRQEVMHFSRQMAAFVRTGIPITEALEVVEQGTGNKRFKQIVGTMRDQIETGVPFSEALAEHALGVPAVLTSASCGRRSSRASSTPRGAAVDLHRA